MDMVEIINVSSISKIPNIEMFLGHHLKFSCYNFDDNIRTYEFSFEVETIYEFNIICSNKEPILDRVLFDDLMTFEGLSYFSFSIGELEDTNELYPDGCHIFEHFVKKSYRVLTP